MSTTGSCVDMAILIRVKTKNWSGNIDIHEVYKGYELTKPEFQKKAREFDKFIKEEIHRIEKEIFSLGYLKKGSKKDAKCHHWIGVNLNKIKSNESLHKLDKKWVLESIQFHAGTDSPLYHKNRGVNRIAYNYDIFLSEIPFDEVEMLNWGEWVTLFDTYAFHSDERAMEWLKNNLDHFKNFNNSRIALRKLVPILNKEFCKPDRDLSYLSDEEFLNEISSIFDSFLKNNPDI